MAYEVRIMTFWEVLGNFFLDFLEWLFLEFGGSREYKNRIIRESSLAVERFGFTPNKRGFDSPLSRNGDKNGKRT